MTTSMPAAIQGQILPQPLQGLRFAGCQSAPQKTAWPGLKDVYVSGPAADDLKGHRKQALLEQARQAQSLAQNAGALDAYEHSGKHYGAYVTLENGVSALGTSVDLALGKHVCDLRAATTMAVIESLKQGKGEGLVVKSAVLVNSDVAGGSPNPCSDCQVTMAGPHFTPESLIGMFSAQAGARKPFELNLQRVRDLLPFSLGKTSLPVSHRSLDAMPMDVSDKAKAVMERDGIGLARMQELLEEAKAQYGKNSGAEYSGKRTGAAVWMSAAGGINQNSVVGLGRRRDLSTTTQWMAADMDAFSDAMRQLEDKQVELRNTGVRAIAYYGEDADLPPITSLGAIGRYRGSEETLVVIPEQDRVKVRTIGDYMPRMYRVPRQ